MNTLWVFAHPEARSLNGSLRDEGIARLRENGHDVRVSDLYAMGWKAVADGGDFPGRDPDAPVRYGPESEAHQASGALSPDILAEQEKITWADNLVIQFPLWWYAAPAILKGWFDRVFTKGFGYGIADPMHPGRTLRYGDGLLAGKRAMLVVTAGGREASLGPRGVNGSIDELLFPIQHGLLWYVGISVVPPLVHYGANRVDAEAHAALTKSLRARLDGLESEDPIPFRFQNRGDYDDDLVLEDNHAPGRSGLGIHVR
ncbi:NAD(P)H-dependent oxidoreductase [Nocardioides sp. Soil796]|uniref:NAD(P)H-dependent oxidoreductase n=1 Tax=Nocardioides sp. Soil796 TaxID=1736412 RepID=UPI00070D3C35|nr:NAD(P)H-dependent oxidoreductase [Nocardioides sp. Soil796]KRF11796.1 NADPH-quinone reductase [Nocardioides sp. Soil796]